jgi:hypothetical protein
VQQHGAKEHRGQRIGREVGRQRGPERADLERDLGQHDAAQSEQQDADQRHVAARRRDQPVQPGVGVATGRRVDQDAERAEVGTGHSAVGRASDDRPKPAHRQAEHGAAQQHDRDRDDHAAHVRHAARARLTDQGQEHREAADDRRRAQVVARTRSGAAEQGPDDQRDRQHQHDERLHQHHRPGGQRADLQQEADEIAPYREQPPRVAHGLQQSAGVSVAFRIVHYAVLHDDRGAVDHRRCHAETDGQLKRHGGQRNRARPARRASGSAAVQKARPRQLAALTGSSGSAVELKCEWTRSSTGSLAGSACTAMCR